MQEPLEGPARRPRLLPTFASPAHASRTCQDLKGGFCPPDLPLRGLDTFPKTWWVENGYGLIPAVSGYWNRHQLVMQRYP